MVHIYQYLDKQTRVFQHTGSCLPPEYFGLDDTESSNHDALPRCSYLRRFVQVVAVSDWIFRVIFSVRRNLFGRTGESRCLDFDDREYQQVNSLISNQCLAYVGISLTPTTDTLNLFLPPLKKTHSINYLYISAPIYIIYLMNKVSVIILINAS